MIKSCLNCSLFSECTHTKKAFSFLCDEHLEFKKKKKKKVRTNIADAIKEEYEEQLPDNEINDIIGSMIDSPYPVPQDIRIDDRDLPYAKNFFDFCTNSKFNSLTMYPRQLEVGLKYNLDICPNCSNPKFLKKMEVNATYEQMQDNLQFFEHGVCPRCKGTRSEFVVEKLLTPFTELVFCSGQRSGKCVKGDTIILTSNGLVEIQDLANNSLPGFSERDNITISLEDGKKIKVSHFYVDEKNKTINIKLGDGKELGGTYNHPIKTTTNTIQDWTKLSNISIDKVVPIYVGQDVWAESTPSLITHARKARKKFELWYNSITNKARVSTGRIYYEGLLNEKIARLLGFWVSEGTGGYLEIWNNDVDVLNLCAEAYIILFGCELFSKTTKFIRDRSCEAFTFFNELVDNALSEKHKSAQKRIPRVILESPKKLVQAFMQALYEGDGGFNKDLVEYCTISKKLASQIQIVLNNFGIICNIKEKQTWTSNGTKNQKEKTAYLIHIEGSQLEKFEQEIGFLSERKKTRLTETIEKHKNKKINMPFWYEKYPEEFKQRFIHLMNQVQIDLNNSKKDFDPSIKEGDGRGKFGKMGLVTVFGSNNELNRIKSKNVALSRRRILDFIEKVQMFSYYLKDTTENELNWWYDLATNKNLYFTTVEKIVYNKEKEVTYDLAVPNYHRFMANGLLNHNTFLGQVLAEYSLHRLFKLQHPAVAYDLAPSSILNGTFVGLSLTAAKEQLFNPFLKLQQESQWFKDLHKMLDYYGNKYGEELYRIKDTFVDYKVRGLHLSPSDPHIGKLRGKTRMIAVPDELGWFNAKQKDSVKFDAVEIHKSLKNSTTDIANGYRRLLKEGYNDIPPPLMCCISSPSSRYDMMMQLLEKSKKVKSISAFHHATWEVNPKYSFDDLWEEFGVENETRFWRDFGAQPPLSDSAFIDDPEFKIISSCISKRTSFLGLKQIVVKTSTKKLTGGRVETLRKKIDVYPRILAIDTAQVDNSFAFCLAHLEPQEEEADKIVYDAFLELVPSKEFPISFSQIGELIIEIVKQFNVILLVSDRYQNVKLQQDVENEIQAFIDDPGDSDLEIYEEFEAKTYSVQYVDFENFRQAIYDQNVKFPASEVPLEEIVFLGGDNYPHGFKGKPTAHFLFQCVTVRDMIKTVGKGEGKTDDLFRAAVLAYSFLANIENRELFTDEEFDERKGSTRAIAAIANKSITSVSLPWAAKATGGVGSIGKINGLGASCKK